MNPAYNPYLTERRYPGVSRVLHYRAIPKTQVFSGMVLEKAVKSPLFPLNPGSLSQKLKF
jgi:hypothetical protein